MLSVIRLEAACNTIAVDLDVVWKTVCEDLPALAEQVRALSGALQKDPSTGD